MLGGKRVRGRSYLALGAFSTIAGELSSALAHRAPFGKLELPTGELEVHPGTPLSITGWVLDMVAVTSVAVELDGQLVATLPVDVARPDVCAEYPGYGGCPAPGLSGELATDGIDGCHLLRVIARDGDGNEITLGERVLVAR